MRFEQTPTIHLFLRLKAERKLNSHSQIEFQFNLCVLNMRNLGNVLVTEIMMPRFYFNLTCKATAIPDDSGKELDTLNDAYKHARKLIHKILFHVGEDDAEAWKVVILNDDDDTQMIIPFSVSHRFSAQRRRKKQF